MINPKMSDKLKQPPEKRSKIVAAERKSHYNVTVYGDNDGFMQEISDPDDETDGFDAGDQQMRDRNNVNGQDKKFNEYSEKVCESVGVEEGDKNKDQDSGATCKGAKQTPSPTAKQPVVLKLVKLNSESTSVLSNLLKNCKRSIDMIKDHSERVSMQSTGAENTENSPTKDAREHNSAPPISNAIFDDASDSELTNNILDVDINHNLFQALKEKIATLTEEKDKLVSLIWDEMNLNASLEYDSTLDKIIGFEDCGKSRSFVFADRVLIFMIRWINKNWKLPLCFTFHSSRSKSVQLVSILKNHVRALHFADLKVVALVCKHNNRNITAIKMLEREARNMKLQPGSTIEHDQIMIRGMEMVPILDPPYLLKCLRDNFMANDIELKLPGDSKTRNTAKWSHLQLLRNLDVYSEVNVKGLWRLPEEVVNEKLLNRTKVKNATKIFSRTCATFMAMAAHYGYTTSDGDKITGDALNTSKVLLFINDLFDSLNGSAKRADNSLRCGVSRYSDHWAFWMEAQEKLGNMQFVDRVSGAPTPRISCFEYWMKTVDGFLRLWQKLLEEKGFVEFSPRYLNADPLETFLSAIRDGIGEHGDPSCGQFLTVYKRLLRSNLRTRERGEETDCEDDEAEVLIDLACLADNASADKSQDVSKELQELIEARTEHSYSNDCSPSCVGKAGLIAECLLKSTIDCGVCRTLILKDSRESSYPLLPAHLSAQFLRSLETIDHIVQHALPSMCYKKFLRRKLLAKLHEQESLEWLRCDSHGADLRTRVYDLVINLQLRAFCSIVNKILAGDDMKHIDYGSTNNMFKQARLYSCQNVPSARKS